MGVQGEVEGARKAPGKRSKEDGWSKGSWGMKGRGGVGADGSTTEGLGGQAQEGSVSTAANAAAPAAAPAAAAASATAPSLVSPTPTTFPATNAPPVTATATATATAAAATAATATAAASTPGRQRVSQATTTTVTDSRGVRAIIEEFERAGNGQGVGGKDASKNAKEGSPAIEPTQKRGPLRAAAGTKTFSLSDLRRATGNFDPCNLIGRGRTSLVFKGSLKDGTEIAVKLLTSRPDLLSAGSSTSSGRRSPTGIPADVACKGDVASGAELDAELDQAFVAEASMLQQLHHKNIVQLLGTCWEEWVEEAEGGEEDARSGNPRANETGSPLRQSPPSAGQTNKQEGQKPAWLAGQSVARCLVYRFEANGTLRSHLHAHSTHGSVTGSNTSPGSGAQGGTSASNNEKGARLKSLDWATRLRIAVGTAQALKYLHEDASVAAVTRQGGEGDSGGGAHRAGKAGGAVVHGNVTSSNVLLGGGEGGSGPSAAGGTKPRGDGIESLLEPRLADFSSAVALAGRRHAGRGTGGAVPGGRGGGGYQPEGEGDDDDDDVASPADSGRGRKGPAAKLVGAMG